MKINNFLTAFAVLLLLSVISGPFPLTAQVSLTNDNTASLFDNDIDNFMDPNDYDKVEFDSFFAALQHDAFYGDGFTSINPDTNLLSAGFAKYFGGIYAGLYYVGDIYEYMKDDNAGNEAHKTFNFVQAMIGSQSFGGIKVGFGIQQEWDTGNTPFGPVTAEYGIYTVMAGWGKNFELSNGSTLKPEVNAAYVFPSSGGSASFQGIDLSTLTGLSFSVDYIVAVSLETDWVLAPKENTERICSFGYNLAVLHISSIVDFNMFFHTIFASYKQIYDLSEQFSVAFNCGIDFSLASFKMSSGGVSAKSSFLVFTPQAAAGFIYRFNSPFSVNAGLGLSYDITRTSISSGGGSVSDSTWDGFRVTTSAGGSFEPNSSLAIDFSWASNNRYYDSNLGSLTLGVRIKR